MFDYAPLAALAAVVRTGGFDKAALRLNVTPSAVSQRIKSLEESVGATLVVRGKPSTATPAGLRLVRHAEEVGLLERTLHADLASLLPAGRRATLRLAVNADSLATWFVEAMAGVEGVLFDLVLDDQDHSADWLRRGEVSAAVSAHRAPIQGCDRRPLGALRYLATASPRFVARWFRDGVDADALTRAPALTYDAKDELQAGWVAALVGRRIALPTHWLPASHAFADAAVAGVGWGMNPEPLVAGHIAAGRLVPLVSDRPLDVPLHWHWSRMVAPALGDLNDAVRAAAARWLVPLAA